MVRRFVRLGHHPKDSEDEKLKKSSLLVVSGPFAIAGLLWGILYFSQGLIIPGAIPFSYGIISIVNIISFGITKKYAFFRNSQLFFILILPFALQTSLGGFVQSSAVMYWAIIAPAGAMFFDSIRRSAYWFGAYLLLVVIAYLINDFLPGYVNWNLSERFVNVLFLMNTIGVSSLVFGILYYFVSTITELNKDIKNKNQALKEHSEKLREMDRIKSRFFANISHEFRTPLTLILGLVNKQIGRSENPPDPKDSFTMKRNAQQLLQLINQLLDLSKLESGELKLQVSKSDIIAFVRNITALFESSARDKQVALTFNGNPIEENQLWPSFEIYFDHEKLQKVISNLLSNAVKFTPEKGKIEVEVESLNESGKVSIKVINTGEEIPQDKLTRIFDRFYQVDSDSNRKYEGTGIGLALVKELIVLHQGNVEVESKMKKTTFTITIPANTDHHAVDEMEERIVESLIEPIIDTDKSENTKNVISEVEDENRLEILIVEDNSDLRYYFKNLLEPHFKIYEACDGIEGMDEAESLIPDLIISDIMMPRMDGYELCRKLKTNIKTDHIPVILLTAKASRENKLEGLEIGADDYLVKPFDHEELKIRIRNLVDTRKKLQEKFRSEIMVKPMAVKATSIQQKFIENLKKVVEENLDNALFGVEDLGKKVGMSRSQLHRKLKAITDQSATTFIRNYRLYRAADLLNQDVGNITEIAFQVGFNSQTYFSTCFQELFGCTPTAFKEKEKA